MKGVPIRYEFIENSFTILSNYLKFENHCSKSRWRDFISINAEKFGSSLTQNFILINYGYHSKNRDCGFTYLCINSFPDLTDMVPANY